MLTGQAKVNYQRDYMRQRRIDLKKGHSADIKPKTKIKAAPRNAPESATINEPQVVRPNVSPVRPVMLDPVSVRPVLDPDNVRPKVKYPVRPEGISDNQYNMICYKAEKAAIIAV